VTSHHPIRKIVPPEPTVIPDKLYFRIGDVAKLCDVPTYVLRFWETEFPQLKPNKGGTGQRLYRKRDVEMALRIKSLLYDQGYTIPGARQVFSTEAKAASESKAAPEPAPQLVATPAPPQPTAATPAVDVGETIRQEAHRREQISSLRAELRSLSDLLTQPASSEQTIPATEETTPPVSLAAKPKSMSPRLTLEPKPDPKSTPRLIDQGDLFPSE
jgi:DNA-binding transcriptional MerR regulator